MALDRVNSVAIRPDRASDFLESIQELASAAVKKREPWRWTAHQTVFGEGLAFHFASPTESFEQIDGQGQVDALWTRVLGDERGADGFARTNACLQSLRQTVSLQRPDLSYAEGLGGPSEHPYAVLTTVRARPGRADECEELIRKIAEAMPKVGASYGMIAFQVVLGEMNAYWTVRPLHALADLDRMIPAPDLLSQAFGHAEGGLLWRSGAEAVEQARREVVRYLPELSNPPQD